MKRLIVCCDGTQNNPDQIDRDQPAPTNVVKIARAIKDTDGDIKQILYYDPGVGTGWWARQIVEGLSGTGISENIIQAYAFLVANYEPGDEVFCFGFSRGAFTVRSLCGMINRCGLLTKEWLRDDYLKLVYNLYRLTRPEQEAGKSFQEFRRRYTHEDFKVRFLGVWDTVASLGFPLFGDIVFEWNRHHDICNFSDTVLNACHALAIDERRKQFGPRLLKVDDVALKLEQKWFVGAHSNVGGGYSNTGLSDIALEWMIEHATRQGLAFDLVFIDRNINPNPYGELRDSKTGIYKFLKPQVRYLKGEKIPNEELHETVIQRYMEVTTEYQPINIVLSSLSMEEVMKTPMSFSARYEHKMRTKHNKYLKREKRKRREKPITSRLPLNLAIGFVVLLVVWGILSLVWISSDYAFGISGKEWLAALGFLCSMFWKITLIPIALFLLLFGLVLLGFFIWSKVWQWRRRRNPMKR